MYRAIFPGEATAIRWFAYVDEQTNRCLFDEFMAELDELASARLLARMLAFAKMGRWGTQANWFQRLANMPVTTYEIKSDSQRVLFIRCDDDAVAIMGFTKRGNSWGKREWNAVKAAEPMFRAAVLECQRRKKS